MTKRDWWHVATVSLVLAVAIVAVYLAVEQQKHTANPFYPPRPAHTSPTWIRT